MIKQRNIFCYLMVAPALILVSALGIYPMLDSLRLSFVQYDLLRVHEEGSPFVGLRNFEIIFQDPRFLQVLRNTLVFSFIVVTTVVLFGLMIAQVMNREFRGRDVFRAIVLVPWVTPPVVASGIWMWTFQPERSPINQVLRELGIISTNIGFLTDTTRTFGPISIPMLAVSVVRVWGGLPFVSVMILAGLQAIPTEIYEAAEIDGASSLQRFFFVTLPMLRPVLSILVTLLVIGSVGVFGVHYIMTGGGPNYMTSVLAVLAYQQAFTFWRFDLAAAMSTVIMIITGTIAVFYVRSRIRELVL